MAKLLFFLALWATCATAQTVEGSVIDSATGRGLASVRVEFLQGTKAIYDATTDARGHFTIEGVKDGTYSARYTCSDYWPSDPGTPGPFQANMGVPKQTFQVVAGGNPVKLEAHMRPLPRLTGRVVNGKGQAVPDAQVELTGRGLTTRTNAEGRFDVHQFLLPGAYTLSVVPPPGIKPPDPEPDSDRVLNWTRTYYPGVALPEAASKIVLRPGETLDIKLELLAVPAHALRGVLLNSDGTPAPRIEITVGERTRGPQMLRAKSNSDGTFEFPAVVDGEWSLLAEAESEGVDLQAQQWVEMAGHRIDSVKLRLSPPFTVRGKVTMEKPEGAPPPPPPMVFLSPHAGRVRDGFITLGPHATPDADGSFSLENVYPGAYSIRVEQPAPPYYLDAVRVGEVEVTTQEVEFSSGSVPITLVYKANGGAVRGTAERCDSGWVALVPQNTSVRRAGMVHGAKCNSNDRYEITAVRPGEYYALAFAGDGDLPWNAILDGRLFNQANRVTVEAGETTSADLRAIERPPN